MEIGKPGGTPDTPPGSTRNERGLLRYLAWMGRLARISFSLLVVVGVVSLSSVIDSASSAASSPALEVDRSAVTERAKLKRHQSRYWVWYAPKAWVATQGAAGIDVSSPDSGRMWVGAAFSGTGFPVTHDQVFGYLQSTGGLDSHPLRSVRVTRVSGERPFGSGSRRVYEWTARRVDLKEAVRGKLKVDVFSSIGYGFALAAIVGPSRTWRKNSALLERLAGLIFYRPQEVDPWDRPWE